MTHVVGKLALIASALSNWTPAVLATEPTVIENSPFSSLVVAQAFARLVQIIPTHAGMITLSWPWWLD